MLFMVKKYYFSVFIVIVFLGIILISYLRPNGKEPIPHIMIDGTTYHAFNFDNITSAPDDTQIVGIITSTTSKNKIPTTHEQSNFLECLYQPYAFIENELIIHISYTKNYGNTPWLVERWIKMDKCNH